MTDQSQPTDDSNPDESRSVLLTTLVLLSVAVVVGFLYFAREVVVPITLAILLSFLLSPTVRALCRWRIGRVTAVAVTVLVAFFIIFGFAAVVVYEISSLARDLPENRYNLEAKVRSLPELVPGGAVFRRITGMLRDLRKELTRENHTAAPLEHLSPSSNVAEPAKPIPVEIRQPDLEPLQLVQSVVGPLLQPLAVSGLVIVFVIMILIDWEDLRDRLLRLGGRHDLSRTTEAMNEAGQRVRQYLTRLLVVNLTCGIPIGVGLTVIGIPNAALWAIFVVLLRFVPYLGIVIAACFPLALAIAVDPGWTLLLWTISLFVVVELIVANFVEPWVYGSGAGLSPVALIVAAVCWTWLWGPVGLLLSTPLTACLVVLGRHVRHLEFLDVLLGNEPVLTPEETFYQRLLADDSDDATEQAEEFAKERSFAEFFDEVAIPALVRMQADRDRGAISAERCAKVRQCIKAMLENLFDDTIEEAGQIAEYPARPEGESVPAIYCIAGHNDIDGAAALVLAYLLRLEGRVRGHQVRFADVPLSDVAYPRAFEEAGLVFVSLISTSAPARVRYLVRRIRRRAPDVKVVVGLWGLSPEGLAAAKAALGGSVDIVTSVRVALAEVPALVSRLDNDPDSLGGARPSRCEQGVAAGC